MILGSAGFSFIRARVIPPCFLIFVPVLLAEPPAPVCVFPPWLSATCAYNTFVDILHAKLHANIEVVERVRSEYRLAECDIGADAPSLTARISVTISPSSLVLSKASGSFLYPSIYSSRVLASITIMLAFFWAILLILSVYLRKVSSAEPGLRRLLLRRKKSSILLQIYLFRGLPSPYKGGILLLPRIIGVLKSLYKA
jgi:hypothetical protein